MTQKDKLLRYSLILLIYLFGLAGQILYGYSRLQQTTESRITWIYDQIHMGIAEITDFYDRKFVRYLPMKNCERFLYESQPLLLASPYIRAVSATHGGVIMCSSIMGPVLKQIDNWQPSGRYIELKYVEKTPFSDLFPKNRQSVLALHFELDNYYGLYVAIYPESLYKILGSAEFATTFVKFGNATLYSNGNVTQENNNLGEGELFAVGSNYRIEDVLKYSVEHYGVISLIWTFIIFVSAKSLVHHMYQFNLNYWRVRRAIKLKQFHPYIQPVVNKSGEVTGGEVLVRWHHPKRGVISPLHFINRVEENGQIVGITSVLMDKCATAFAKVDMPARARDFRLGFNVCSIQFDTEVLVSDIQNFQKKVAKNPVKLVIELTERQEFSCNEKYIAAIRSLREQDVLVALDDYGTGHCSLKYLLNTQVDMIKIDMMYVATIDSGKTKILDNIINLARSLDVPLLAEGVENDVQFTYLKNMKIERYQGYFFDKPLPIEEFIEKYIAPTSMNAIQKMYLQSLIAASEHSFQ